MDRGCEKPILSFPQQLNSYLDQEITLRGFLYQTEKGWILAAEPNLKSCCIHKKPFIHLDNSFASGLTNHAVTMQGHLSLTEKNPPRYHLSDARILHDRGNDRSIAPFLIVIALFALLIAIIKIKRKDT